MTRVPSPRLLGAGRAAEWEAAMLRHGALSIVVQGPVTQANLATVHDNVRCWRRIFPRAQLILSVSTCDIDGFGWSRTRRWKAIFPVGRDPHSANVAGLERLCDRIVLAEQALVLPPLKFGETAPNHGNVQIAAARAGLRYADGTYTLRVRNDLVFRDRSFLAFYFDRARADRHLPFGFEDRVMIAQLFTLNPLGLERLPFHFSDFFHFGRTGDVRSIWIDLPPISPEDSRYFVHHRHALDSNDLERRFRTKLGVEQHIHFHSARKIFPDAVLRFHNDRTSAEASIAFLTNDFIVCDMVRCRAAFPKWGKLFGEPLMKALCVTDEDWSVLNQTDDLQGRAIYLAAKADAWRRRSA